MIANRTGGSWVPSGCIQRRMPASSSGDHGRGRGAARGVLMVCTIPSGMAGRALDGRVALVTGAGSGIGAAVAGHPSERGAAGPTAGGRREPLKEVAAGLPGPSCIVPGDIADPDAAAGVVALGVGE